jgi:transposase
MGRRKYRHYTDEFRTEAIRLANLSGRTSKVARELGIPKGTLSEWVTEAQRSTPQRGRDTTGDVDDKAEIERLKAELERMTLERDFLKKAAAFFAKNQS